MGPGVMSLVLTVVPFFCGVACLVISNIILFFRLFLQVVRFLFQLPFLPLHPSYGFGLGVRGGPPWCLPFGFSLALFVFVIPFHFAT